MPGPLDGLKRVGPRNTVEQELADILNAAAHKEDYGPNSREPYRDGSNDGMLPMPKPAPGFRRGTLVPFSNNTNDTLESPWEMIRRIAPNMEGRSPSITMGPATEGASMMLDRSGIPPDKMGSSNLMGITDIKNRIGINPSLGWGSYYAGLEPGRIADEHAVTVGHEMGHTVGIPEAEMGNIEGLVRMIRDSQRMGRKR